MKACAYWTVLYSACLTTTAASAASQFVPIGGFGSDGFESVATALSADGTTVIGWANIPGSTPSEYNRTEAFRWTGPEGIALLRPHTSQDYKDSFAWGVSVDGQVVAGNLFSITVDANEAFRWNTTEGVVGLGFLPSSQDSAAGPVAPDGLTIYGGSDGPFRWTAAAGLQPFTNIVTAISADSSTIVGFFEDATQHTEAYLSNQSAGMIGLGFVPGDPQLSAASVVSADGRSVVGKSGDVGGFRWTATGGMQGLGFLRDSDLTYTTAVSPDGKLVFGESYFDTGNEAFIWDDVHGIRSFQDLLTQGYGLTTALAGWKLDGVAGVSLNGRVIAGNGINPDGNEEAWLIRLDQPIGVPEPSSLALALLAAAPLLPLARRKRVTAT